jgi:hypothetical protein
VKRSFFVAGLGGNPRHKEIGMHSRRFNSIRVALLSFLLMGCDVGYGVNRSVGIKTFPLKDEVEKAISTVPGIDRVEYKRVSPAKNLVGPTEPSYDSYVYQSGEVWGAVEFRTSTTGKKTLKLYYMTLNRKPSPQKVKEIREKMDEIYSSLRKHIPDLPPPEEVKEELLRVSSS